MQWVSRDTCSLVDQDLGECSKIEMGESEIMTLSKLVFPCVVRWLLSARDSVLYSAKSRCKAVISCVGDFFTLKSLYSPNFILLKSVCLCSFSTSAGDTLPLYLISVRAENWRQVNGRPSGVFCM